MHFMRTIKVPPSATSDCHCSTNRLYRDTLFYLLLPLEVVVLLLLHVHNIGSAAALAAAPQIDTPPGCRLEPTYESFLLSTFATEWVRTAGPSSCTEGSRGSSHACVMHVWLPIF